MSKHTETFEDELDPGCSAFEQTLLLIDGALEGPRRTEAELHASACATCAPLVSDWVGIGSALRQAFDDAAEAAKPDLVLMPARVLEAVYPTAPAAKPGPFAAIAGFFRRAQPWMLIGATAGALALVIPSLLSPPSPTPPPALAELGDDEAPPVVVVRDLDFGETTDGMVYRTPRGGMTIIWVTENEGA